MALKQELEDRVSKFLKATWTRRDGRTIPDDTSINLDNDGVDLDATVLYADLRGSTKMVEDHRDSFAAEIYKSFLYCAARILTGEGGTITSYDGDRIMAVFIGGSKNTSAVRAGLKINYARQSIIQPLINKHYTTTFILDHTAGIDTSKLLVAKTGARGSNDLVWVGRSANYAAKFTEFSEFPTYISHSVYDNIHADAKFSEGIDMWNRRSWTEKNNFIVYGSTYWWTIV